MITTTSIQLSPENNLALNNLCGPHNRHLDAIQKFLKVQLANRGHYFYLTGEKDLIDQAMQVLIEIYAVLQSKDEKFMLDTTKLDQYLKNSMTKNSFYSSDDSHHSQYQSSEFLLPTPCQLVKPKTLKQAHYLQCIKQHDLNFGIGPAGTGKTYLAVAFAVLSLETKLIDRIILVRPAVEAGEKLGFLPGDFTQKLDPYFRPLYDALYEMLGFKQTMRLIENHTIEIAPLAYMRGRTLNNAFVILDEAQNTLPEQMKMFLTRIGFRSKVVINGDITQNDLPKGSQSGLKHCLSLLRPISEIGFTEFSKKDIVRHPLVQTILKAYEKA